MYNYEKIEAYPELGEILLQIEKKIVEASCPPDQKILTNKQLCDELQISVRTAATLRSTKTLPYHKVNGIVLYLMSDVLQMLKRHRVESVSNKSRFNKPKINNYEK